MATIKDIYAGKPDAKDEVEAIGIDPFIENYVVPDNFNKDSLIKGTSYYITGYKGTGKTALLYYLDSFTRQLDPQTCSSFIFFKGDFTDVKKQELEQLSKRLFSSISIENDVVLDGKDFEYIWRWLLYCRIIEDNQQNNYGLFKKSVCWEKFESAISRIEYKKKKRFLSIPKKVHLECKTMDPSTGTVLSPSADLDFGYSKVEDTEAYRLFVNMIDEADELFSKIVISDRTDIPYFIFIDELEAYYGEENIFKRDLNLIRDLIFSVKKLNQVMGRNRNVVTKIICSVRSEIINSINRFAISKELNKVISGFETPLKWDYNNTNSFQHPILKILIKRIKYAEPDALNEKEIIEKWFPECIHGSDAANYILNNSWCKPRDIVRLILSAQNCMAADNGSFSQNTIDLCRKKYSQDSLDEIKEEMRALYSAEEIDIIMNCLTGFKRVFSYRELLVRIDSFYKNTFLEKRLQNILVDLYRLGIVGNYMSGSYRWQHKGDERIICDNNWKIIIHPALQSALSINNRQDMLIDMKEYKEGDQVNIIITDIKARFAFGYLLANNTKQKVFLPISEISNSYVSDINDYIKCNEKYRATLLKYDDTHNNWVISMKSINAFVR